MTNQIRGVSDVEECHDTMFFEASFVPRSFRHLAYTGQLLNDRVSSLVLRGIALRCQHEGVSQKFRDGVRGSLQGYSTKEK